MREKILTALGLCPKREGISLVLVLLIAFCGMAILGAVVYSTSSVSGSYRVAINIEDIYVRMQSEIESAKAALILEMSGAAKPLRMRSVSPIGSPDDLVVRVDGGAGELFPPANVDRAITVGGVNGSLSVRILDMRYDADEADDEALVALLPPCMEDLRLRGSGEGSSGMASGESSDSESGGGGTGGGAPSLDSVGVYLIRSTVTVGEKTNTIETSVIQRAGHP